MQELVNLNHPCRTTITDELADRPQDLVNRQFKADRPNEGCVADIPYVKTIPKGIIVPIDDANKSPSF